MIQSELVGFTGSREVATGLPVRVVHKGPLCFEGNSREFPAGRGSDMFVTLDADKVRHSIAARGLSREQIAVGSAVSRVTVTRIMHGQRVQSGNAAAVMRWILAQPVLAELGEFVA